MSEFPMYPECHFCGKEPADNHSTAQCRDRLLSQLHDLCATLASRDGEIARLRAALEKIIECNLSIRASKIASAALKAVA